MSDNIKKWYVLRAIGGKEKKVKEYIDSEIVRLKLGEFISQVLIPTEKVYQIRSGKKISKERTFFPGYFGGSRSYRRNPSLAEECSKCYRVPRIKGR